MCGQVKEVVQATCAVCQRNKDVNFYSLSICNGCQECPTCGTPANECFQTKPYFCLASNALQTGISCTKCGSHWGSRLELDRAVVYKATSGPAPICKLCGKDVHHSHKSVWKVTQGVPNICPECLDCPTCKTGGNFFVPTDGMVKCVACGDEWSSLAELEKQLCRGELH